MARSIGFNILCIIVMSVFIISTPAVLPATPPSVNSGGDISDIKVSHTDPYLYEMIDITWSTLTSKNHLIVTTFESSELPQPIHIKTCQSQDKSIKIWLADIPTQITGRFVLSVLGIDPNPIRHEADLITILSRCTDNLPLHAYCNEHLGDVQCEDEYDRHVDDRGQIICQPKCLDKCVNGGQCDVKTSLIQCRCPVGM